MPDEMLPDVAIAGKMDGFLGRRGSLCNDLCAKGAREQTGLVAWCEHGFVIVDEMLIFVEHMLRPNV
eukprot:1139987-Pelagomonas_calceolata.AAC.7